MFCGPGVGRGGARRADLAMAARARRATRQTRASRTRPWSRELTQPTNSIEAGVGYVSQDSFKFGQYNGLFNKGAYGIFNFDLGGGAPYDSDSAHALARLGNEPRPRRPHGLRRIRRPGHVQGLGHRTTSCAATTGPATRIRRRTTAPAANVLTLPGNWVKPVVPQVNATTAIFAASRRPRGSRTPW